MASRTPRMLGIRHIRRRKSRGRPSVPDVVKVGGRANATRSKFAGAALTTGGGLTFGGGGGGFPTGGGGFGSGGGFGGGGGGLSGILQRGIEEGCHVVPEWARSACEDLVGTGIDAITGGGGGGGGGGGFGGGTGSGIGQADCAPGCFAVPFTGRCICPGDVPPGGAPGFPEAGGRATQGSFGMPAITPLSEQRTHRSCPSGMVLGQDNLCYPRAILPRRSRFRKWRQSRKPLFTAGDLNAIQRADRLVKKAKRINKDLGMRTPSRPKK